MGKKTWTFRSEGKNEIARPTPDKAFYFQNHLCTVDNEEDAILLRNMGYEEVFPEEQDIEKLVSPELKKKLGPRILAALKKLPFAAAKELLKQLKVPYEEEINEFIEELEKPPEKEYVCPVCGKKFDSQNALNSHMKKHKTP